MTTSAQSFVYITVKQEARLAAVADQLMDFLCLNNPLHSLLIEDDNSCSPVSPVGESVGEW